MEIDISKVSVAIGMPTYRPIPRATAMSLCNTVYRAAKAGLPINIIMDTSGIVQWSRDAVLHHFLETGYTKLFWIDSDMVWTPEDFFRLVALSTKYDVVGAAYPLKQEGQTLFTVRPNPTPEIGEGGVVTVNGMGLGFTIIDWHVARQLEEKGTPARNGLTGTVYPAVFHAGVVNGDRSGEDFGFFDDVMALGYKVWMDPSIELGHVGEKEWRGRVADNFRHKEQMNGRDSDAVAGRTEAGTGEAAQGDGEPAGDRPGYGSADGGNAAA